MPTAGSAAPAPGPTASAPGAGADGRATVPASAQDGAPDAAAPARTDWNDVRLAVRLSDLGPLARDVYLGLQRVRAALEGCYEADAKDQAAHPRAPNQEDGWGAAIVTLQMEGRPGELVIVNAPLQELGTSATSLVDCSEGVLRGFRIPAGAAVPGQRYRLQYQLTP